MKKLLSILIALTIMMTATACGGDTNEPDNGPQAPPTETETGDEDIVIGCIAPLTGDVAVYGMASRNGTLMAVNEINEAGGVGGRKIVLIEMDDQGDQADAMNAYNRLVSNDNAVAIIGAVTSSPTSSVAIEAAKEGIPMITPTGTALDITEYGDNIFRACFLDSTQGSVMAKYTAQNIGKTAAIIYNTGDDYSTGLAEAFKTTFEENGGTIVIEQGYSSGAVDFKSQLTNIKQANPEVLYVPYYYDTTALIARQSHEVGLDAILCGPDGWDGLFSVIDDTELLEGYYFSNHYAIGDEDPKVTEFVSKYRALYNEDPNAFSALGYDAAYIMKDAMEKAGSTDYEAVVAALAQTDGTYVTGTITFDPTGNPIKPVSITRIENGVNTLADRVMQ